MRIHKKLNFAMIAILLLVFFASINNVLFLYNKYGSSYTQTIYINDVPISVETESITAPLITSMLILSFAILTYYNVRTLDGAVKLNIKYSSQDITFLPSPPKNWWMESSPQLPSLVLGIDNYVVMISRNVINNNTESRVKDIIDKFFNENANICALTDHAQCYSTLGEIKDVYYGRNKKLNVQ